MFSFSQVINRRAFLKAATYLSALISGLSIERSLSATVNQSESDVTGYGMSKYGTGEYPARMSVYLPFTPKESD